MGKKGQSRASAQEKPRSRFLSHAGLWVILLVFLTLSLLHSLIVPITQGEDELAHYRYASFIAQHGRLPADRAERQQAWYRADWPPFYHLLVGLLVSPLDTDRPHLKDVGESPRRRLVGQIVYPRLIILTEDANWPWQDGILAWHLGRFLSVLFAAVALVFTYLTALELCRASKPRRNATTAEKPGPFGFSANSIAVVATALLAFSPRYLFSSAMLSDDSLFILLSAIFIWLLLRALRGNDRWWVYALLGLLLGLSITTKYSTGLLPLVVIPVVWWCASRANWPWPKAAGRVALTWIAMVIGASWWFGWIEFHFNTIERDGIFAGLLSPLLAAGPDVSMRRIFAIFTNSQFAGQLRPGAIEAGSAWDWLVYFFQTFWGVPVLEADPLFPWAYLVVLGFCLLALVGLCQYWRVTDEGTRATTVVLALVILLLIPFPVLRFFLTFNVLETGQGRHLLYPAAQAIPILLTLGWAQLTWQTAQKVRQRKSATRARSSAAGQSNPDDARPEPGPGYVAHFSLYLPIILLLPWAMFQVSHMKATYPDPLPVQTTTFSQNAIPQPLKHNFGDSIQFLGYDFQPDPELAIINLTLFWKALQPVDENYRTQVQLVSKATGRAQFTWLSHPVNGYYPTRAWDAGDVIRDALPLPLAAVPPGTYDITVDLLHETEATSLAAQPFEIIQFDLGRAQPIVEASTLTVEDFNSKVKYRLWTDGLPVRFRQTLPLSWSLDSSHSTQDPAAETRDMSWVLIGPDNVPRSPAAVGAATAIFLVGADWPSGDYRLGLQLAGTVTRTDPLLTVANEARLFDLPAEIASQSDWITIDANFADLIKLNGYSLPARYLKPGDRLSLNLAWQSLAPVLPDTVTFAVLVDAAQQAHGAVDRYPAGYYSPMLWAEGEVVLDSISLPVQPDAPPGVYYLHLGQYRLVDGQPESLPLVHQGEQLTDTAVVIGPLKIGGPPPELVTLNPDPQIGLNQQVGDQITLLGYDLELVDSTSASRLEDPGPNLRLTLYWQANDDITSDYTTFLHLRNEANEIAGQKDSRPASGQYPTSLWSAGEVIIDEIVLPLDQVSSGRYRLVVGLYELETGNRLTVEGVPANEVELQSFQLAE
jgi:hypothetical protein